MREHFCISEKFPRSTEIIYVLRVNILRLTIGTNLVSVIKEQKYYFESERIILCNVQVLSLLVHFQMNH